MPKFEWDPPKAASNLKQYGVSFEEAQSAFYDDFAIQFFDEEHFALADRFILLGLSSQAKLLVVCHCERADGEIVRIISARKATKRETSYYRGAKDEV